MNEIEFIPTTPELSPELQATYEDKRPDITYAVGCGDDRSPTEVSRAKLTAEGNESLETGAYIRYYGSGAGIARVFAVAMLEKGQGQALSTMGDSFTDVMDVIRKQVEASSKVILNLHSAESNEDSADQFNPEGEKSLGCAYAANTGTLGHIAAEFPDHETLTEKEQTELFGDANDSDSIREANAAFTQVYFPDSAIAGLSRKDFSDIGAPIQILQGSHAPARETLVAVNFSTDRVSNPQTAKERGTPFYDNDVTQIAEILMRAFPQHDLDPETLLRIMDSDIRATRTALAGNEGAEALKIYRIGTPVEALRHLASVREELQQKN